MATYLGLSWKDVSSVLKPTLGNNKNWDKFRAAALKLHWEAYTSTLWLTKI